MNEFIPNELVWVKLGGVQWPAVVKDKADCKEFLEALKRDPFVVVEFFDKKLHDVHNKNQICRYNCEEKEEIMLKSLRLTKNKLDISENFKKDVITAEKLTDGDIHILSRDKFIASRRQKYDDLFGPGHKATAKLNAKRKTPKSGEDSLKLKTSKYSDIFPDSASKSRRPAGKTKKPAKAAVESPRPNITHPRFIAENDHKIRILAPDSPEPCGATAPGSPQPYRCGQCGFTTARLNVLVLHNKTHVAAAAAKPSTAKRKANSDLGDTTPRKKKRPAGADGSATKSGKSLKSARSDDVLKKSPKSSAKKSASGSPKKLKNDGKSEGEKPRTPVKMSALKPAQSSRPQLLEDWDEDDDEEEAERAKIQSEIDRFISDKKTTKVETPESQSSPTPVDGAAADTDAKSEVVDMKNESVDVDSQESSGSDAAASDAPAAAEEPSERPCADDASAVAVRQQQQERNDALLQAAVDDVLADTAPAALPTLPAAPAALGSFDFTESEPDPPRPRPVRLCQAGSPPCRTAPVPGDDVSSSRPTPTSSADATVTPGAVTASTLPPNLQILSVPGGDGQPDTYVLVSVDERGNVRTVNPLENLEGFGADTLLAYEVAQEDGGTRTAYLNPAALSTSADIKQLLGGDEKVDSTTPVPDSSGK